MRASLREILNYIASRTPYPLVVQGLVSLTLLATLLNALGVLGNAAFAAQSGRIWVSIALVSLLLLSISLVPVRRVSWWLQLLSLIGQCGLTALAQLAFPTPILDYVYLTIVLQAVYLFRPWLWIPFAGAVWLVWSGTIIIDSASLVTWVQSNLAVAFPATCILVAAIVYARQQKRHEQVQQMLRQMQQRYDTLVLALRDVQQRAVLEERQRLAQLITDDLQTALARTEHNVAIAIQQAQTNFARLRGAIAQTRDSASAAIEGLRAAITLLRRADLVGMSPAVEGAGAALPLNLNFGARKDDLLLSSLAHRVLTWVLPFVFVGLVLPITLIHHARAADMHSVTPAMLGQVLVLCGLLVVIYILTQRIRHPLWLQMGLAGQAASVMILVILTQTFPLLLGLLLVIWQIALRLSAIQIVTFLAGMQTSLGVAMISLIPTSIERNTNLLTFGVACMVVAGLLWMARAQLQRRRQAERRLAFLSESTHELARQEAEVRTLATAAERTRMAREFHDDLGHQLVLISVQLQMVEELIEDDPGAALNFLVATGEQLRDAWRSVLSAADALLPLEGHVLRQSLDELVCQYQLRVGARITMNITGSLDELCPATACTIYRTVQEGLTNACKHAQAQHIQIDVCCDGAQVSVRICDNGCGQVVCDTHELACTAHPTDAPGSFGLVGLRERAEALGGSVDAGPLPEGGFCVYLALPLAKMQE